MTDALSYPDALLRRILGETRTIAMVGASANWNRPSFFVMKYLQSRGFRVIPVNPGLAGQQILGETVYARLADVPAPFEMVDIFRNSDAAGAILDEAVALQADKGIRTVWMQLSVRNDAAAERGAAAGLEVIMDRCPKIEFGRLGGELSWQGVNSGIISSKVRRAPGRETAQDRRQSPPPGQDPADKPAPFGFETRAVHAGAAPDPTTGARATPIYQTTSYVFEDTDQAAALFNLHTFGYLYSRLTNPTVSVLEERIASLEGGRAAVCCASGHAAQFLTFFTLLEPGDHFVASRALYGGSLTQFGQSFRKLGWECSFVDPTDIDAFRAAIGPRTKAIFLELLANPGGVIVDVEQVARVAQQAGIPLIVDNTLATPYLCRPFDWGADLVVHSTTKFLSGHGNAVGGAVVESGRFNWSASDKFPGLSQPEPAYHGMTFHETFGDFAFTTKARAVALRDFGPAMAPQNAFLTLTGIETLPLRMDRHVENAKKVAAFLAAHPKVSWVSYAGLPDSPFHGLAGKYLPKGPGAVFTFGVVGGFEAGKKVVEGVRLFSHLANVGDTRSLILHPASTTHRQLSDDQRQAAGAGDEVIRLSVGIETAADLIADLDQALALIA
ncbi:O-acetylhomoserine aminocarboxypropyltransferase [Rhodospirillum rubrum]|uniref:O-acetylhomoserine/O-acetylserine sulfhydrylase n=2 Tax=Rhodospirillum rubrum TaxID=1085 RepID=Q2RSM0_RHORT|nr:O-acetylhomoserine aminocarboxypropyltransferase [Rhodospirillum rubrum]ABC22875.1 O-acetylhomoserine/O-acetylserine sulfhydrylase [Rhodospirillum rubrum ATCC 11170]AEO48598.1 O-acetylhomoserine/O-acetylserine sulfhydrylase [Rhodospirillum rubrum F11]QXG78864.1 O-acetylhomoserine aminocarboxypropyltransferase [Rhodospirillum rubrum]HAQ00607.1 O-acetylhomoserine aminocarboxypropyltransferase [Rhodospirillum rubrum]HCF18301.1 O-acetylhomoserine aminocarboxypropyltransferase [Rhodospirillum ru